MLKLTKNYLISLTGFTVMALMYGITVLYKNYFYVGFEEWIAFMTIKVYSSGLLFSLLFITFFSLSYQKIKLGHILLFGFLNGLIYVLLIFLISFSMSVFPDDLLVDDLRLLIFSTVGALLFLFLLEKTTNIWFSPKEYLLTGILGLLPSFLQIIFHHGVNNTDRGQNIILPWQIIIPMGINFLILMHRKRATIPISNVA